MAGELVRVIVSGPEFLGSVKSVRDHLEAEGLTVVSFKVDGRARTEFAFGDSDVWFELLVNGLAMNIAGDLLMLAARSAVAAWRDRNPTADVDVEVDEEWRNDAGYL